MPGRLTTAIRGFSRPAGIDWAVAGVITVVAELEVGIRYHQTPRSLAVTGLASLSLLGLAWWRRYPLLAMASLAAEGLISAVAGGGQTNVPVFAVFLVSYALGTYAGWRQLLLGALIPPAMTAIMDTLHPGPYPVLNAIAYFAFFEVGAPVVVGRLVRSRARLLAILRNRTAELEVERRLAGAAARSAERLELTGRLDKLVASGVEEIIEQADAAESSSDGQSSASRIEARGRELLEQMRSILLELRPPSTRPAPPPSRTTARPEREAPPGRGFRLAAVIVDLPWDPILAAAFFLALEFELGLRRGFHGPKPLCVLGGLAVAVPFAWCRRRPVAAAAASLAAGTMFSGFAVPLESLLVPIALFLVLPFCVAAFSDRRWALIGLVVCATGLTSAFGLADVVMNGGLVSLGFWGVGMYVRDRSRLVAALRKTHHQLAEERDARGRRAVLEERARVARELHDVVGHTLTVVVLQAGAARRLWDTDRPRALTALRTVATIARVGLTDLLHSLRALDRDEAVSNRLSDMRAVVEMAKAAGLDVELEMRGPQPTVDAEVEVAAYRIVQEALTNVLKHAPGAEARVRVGCSGWTIEVQILNSLRAAEQPSAPGGQGLRSMQARVAELGGSLEWGPCDGLFRVRAMLPVRA